MDKSIAEDLDKILNYLNSNKSNEKLFEILDELKIDKKNKELLFRELDSRNFIHANRVTGGNHFIQITPDGKAFLQSSSSFLRERNQSKKTHIWTTTKQTIMIIGSIMSIIGTGAAIHFGILNYNKDMTINDLNSEIKTLKKENVRLQDKLFLRPTFKTTNNKTIK